MEKENNGSLFYTIPAEIMHDKNLNHAEKLMMALLVGLCRRSGECFCSNEWLGEVLDLDERNIRRILENLEKNNYISREIVSNANNPFKKTRIIHMQTSFKLSLREDKNVRIGMDENVRLHRSKMSGIIDTKNLIEEETSSSPLARTPECAKKEQKRELPKEAEELSKYLFEAIRKIKPDFKAPNFVTWAKDMELLLRVDGKKEDEIKRVIEWLPTSWWIKNVLSTAKLRKHFERLQIEMMKLDQKTGAKPLAMQARKPTKEEIEEWNKNDPFAKELERQKQTAMKAQPSPTASSQQTTSQKSSIGVEKAEDS